MGRKRDLDFVMQARKHSVCTNLMRLLWKFLEIISGILLSQKLLLFCAI